MLETKYFGKFIMIHLQIIWFFGDQMIILDLIDIEVIILDCIIIITLAP